MSESMDAQRKRVRYRSHHTGMKENDLLIGRFADAHLAEMNDKDVSWFEDMLMNNNDIDIHNWIVGKRALPPELDHPVMHKLIESVNSDR